MLEREGEPNSLPPLRTLPPPPASRPPPPHPFSSSSSSSSPSFPTINQQPIFPSNVLYPFPSSSCVALHSSHHVPSYSSYHVPSYSSSLALHPSLRPSLLHTTGPTTSSWAGSSSMELFSGATLHLPSFCSYQRESPHLPSSSLNVPVDNTRSSWNVVASSVGIPRLSTSFLPSTVDLPNPIFSLSPAMVSSQGLGTRKDYQPWNNSHTFQPVMRMNEDVTGNKIPLSPCPQYSSFLLNHPRGQSSLHVQSPDPISLLINKYLPPQYISLNTHHPSNHSLNSNSNVQNDCISHNIGSTFVTSVPPNTLPSSSIPPSSTIVGTQQPPPCLPIPPN